MQYQIAIYFNIGLSELRLEKSFNCLNLHSFAHLYTLNVWLIMWVCSSAVEAVLLAASASFLSPATLNPSRNSDRNKYLIIQFLRFSIANPGKSNINKNY